MQSMRRGAWARTVLFALGVSVLGCASEPEGKAGIDRDLTVGSAGNEVQAWYGYLHTYGYFPNDALQTQYPAWRPLVATAPAHSDVFDARMEEATLLFQENAGLPRTGIVDAPTRQLIAVPRCGVPDGIPPLDPTDKYAINGNSFLITRLNWSFAPLIPGPPKLPSGNGYLPDATVKQDVWNALAGWGVASAYSFSEVDPNSSGTAIWISSANISPYNGLTGPTGAGSVGIAPTQLTTLNSSITWSDTLPVPAGKMDLPTILLHELGHALGMAHSSIPTAVMYPFSSLGVANRALTYDDKIGIMAIAPSWQLQSAFVGPAYDAALNTHTSSRSVWAIGGSSVNGGYQIWENHAGWHLHPGGAVRIAVNATSQANLPWVVNDAGAIFRWNSTIQNWDNIAGCARDIGVGTDDSVWIIGCDGNANHSIQKFTGASVPCSSSCWTTSDGAGLRISVGQRGPVNDPAIVPWVTNDANQIFRRWSSNPAVSGWEQLPGEGYDIAAGGGYAFTVSGGSLLALDEQPAGPGTPPAPAVKKWVTISGRAVSSVSMGDPYPYVVDTSQKLYQAF